jgi:hypothetical protein
MFKLDLREAAFGAVDCGHDAEDAHRRRAAVRTNSSKPPGSIKCVEFIDQSSVLFASAEGSCSNESVS